MQDFDTALRYHAASAFNYKGFDAMIYAYQASGGTTRADDLVLLLENNKHGYDDRAAKRIASREIFSYEWQSHDWVPMFQFDAHDMSLKRGVCKIMQELSGVLDSWTLAAWFVEPNAWLQGKRPVDLIETNTPYVHAAARADRFIAAG